MELHPSTTAYYRPPRLLLKSISGGSSLHRDSASLRALLMAASVPVAFVDDHGVITVVRIAVGDENVDIRESHAVGGGCGMDVLQWRVALAASVTTICGEWRVTQRLAPTPLRYPEIPMF